MSTPPWCKCQASLPPNNQRGTHRPPPACGLGHSYSVRLHAIAVLQIFITLKNDSSTVIAWVKQKPEKKEYENWATPDKPGPSSFLQRGSTSH